MLTDVRGPFTVALFQNAGAYAACFTSSSFTEVTRSPADGSASNAQPRTCDVQSPNGCGGRDEPVAGRMSGDRRRHELG